MVAVVAGCVPVLRGKHDDTVDPLNVVVAGCVPVLREKHENTVDLWLWLSQAVYLY